MTLINHFPFGKLQKDQPTNSIHRIQITSGHSSHQCMWVLKQVKDRFCKEAEDRNIQVHCTESVTDTHSTQPISMVLEITGKQVETFLKTWLGSVKWYGKNQFDSSSSRKSWYVGINKLPETPKRPDENGAIQMKAIRSSGPGGQKVNKTASCVQAVHVKSGVQVKVQDQRSQHQNRKEAKRRIKVQLLQKHNRELLKQRQQERNHHTALLRGNPVRIYQGENFRLVRQNITSQESTSKGDLS